MESTFESVEKSKSEKLVYRLFIAVFYLLALTGILDRNWYNLLPANFVFEGLLFLSALFLFGHLSKKMLPFLLVGIFYFSVTAILAYFNRVHVLDYLQAYKAFIYIIPLCFFFNKNIFSERQVVVFLKVLFVLFLVKYSYSVLLNFNPRMGTRPAIFVENNFELIFLISLFYVFRDAFLEKKTFWFVILSVIVLLSGSRSSLLALLVAFYGVYLNRFSLRTIFYYGAFIILLLITASIFESRMAGGIETIDRFKFMLLFLEEVKHWTVLQFIFGSEPLTPMSFETCKALSFYNRLYSFAGDDTCYSVILHSYFFRVIFDHGVFGLVFLFYFIYYCLTRKGFSKFDSLIVLGILSASALSVSAMNSIFTSVALAIMFAVHRANAVHVEKN